MNQSAFHRMSCKGFVAAVDHLVWKSCFEVLDVIEGSMPRGRLLKSRKSPIAKIFPFLTALDMKNIFVNFNEISCVFLIFSCLCDFFVHNVANHSMASLNLWRTVQRDGYEFCRAASTRSLWRKKTTGERYDLLILRREVRT